MISVNIARDKEGFISEFTVKGHALYGRHGKDIVCAAVSAVAFTALGALDELCGINSYTEKDGFLKCSLPDSMEGDTRNKADIILEAMVIGLKQIELSYGKYVTVLDEEV